MEYLFLEFSIQYFYYDWSQVTKTMEGKMEVRGGGNTVYII
jgi:hypothetical protein